MGLRPHLFVLLLASVPLLATAQSGSGSGSASGSASPTPPGGLKYPFQTELSPKEKAVIKNGLPALPPRDCVRTPTISKCDCKEMIGACNDQTGVCMKNLDRYLGKDPGSGNNVARSKYENFMSKFDHPLLNTFLQKRQARSSKSSMGRKKTESQCGKCFAEDMQDRARQLWLESSSSSMSSTSTSVSFLQGLPHVDFGARVFDENINWLAMKAKGKCTGEEMQGLDECLAVYWQCSRSLGKMEKEAAGKDAETKHIRAHPGEMPGFFR